MDDKPKGGSIAECFSVSVDASVLANEASRLLGITKGDK